MSCVWRIGSRRASNKLGVQLQQSGMTSVLLSSSSSSSSSQQRRCLNGGVTTQQSVNSLDMFEMMNAIFNQGSGGGMSSAVLRDQAKMLNVFVAIDTYSNGYLTREDFATAASLCTMALTSNEIQGIFDSIDTNHSNTIEFGEFQEAIGNIVNLAAVDDLANADASVQRVVRLWNDRMSGNARAAQVFTSKLRKEPSLGTLQNVQLDRQVQMVYGMIGNAFQALGRPDNLKKVLENEGARHKQKFNMDSGHYQAVRRSLFATLPEVLGADYNEEVHADFEKQFGFIETALTTGSG